MSRLVAIWVSVALAVASAASAQDWPMFGGSPSRNNAPASKSIITDWDVGTAINNLGDYDDGTKTVYTWDDDGASNNYFGVSALEEDVSGWFAGESPISMSSSPVRVRVLERFSLRSFIRAAFTVMR